MLKFLDTNILLEKDYLDYFKNINEKFIISSESLNELENIKTNKNKDFGIKYSARQTVRFLEANKELYDVVVCNTNHHDLLNRYCLQITADNLIIACVKLLDCQCEFVTNDLLCRIIAKDIFKLDIGKIDLGNKSEYQGYKIVKMNNGELSEFYTNMNENSFGCLINEYLVIQNSDDEIVDKYKWSGEQFEALNYKQVTNSFSGKIKPRNIQQELAFDMLYSDKAKIKVLRGIAGAGKDFLMTSIALDLVSKHKFEKIIWVRNNYEVRNTRQLGYLPGSKYDKLKPMAMILADSLGGEYGLDMLISQGKIVLEHLGMMRGRDLKNSIVLCSEMENSSREHVQLLVSRISEGSELWINGDINQIDDVVFESDNGLVAIIDKLKGNSLFGYVELKKTERSKVAELAKLLN